MRMRHLAWELVLMSASAVASLMHGPAKGTQPRILGLFGGSVTLASIDPPSTEAPCVVGDRMPVIRPDSDKHHQLRIFRPDASVRFEMPVLRLRLCDDQAADDRREVSDAMPISPLVKDSTGERWQESPRSP